MGFFVAAIVVAFAGGTLYCAFRSRGFVKFLSGAFFVSGGIQLYLYVAGVSIPILGTDFVQPPRMSGVRSVIHLALFAITLYFGYVRKPKS